MWLLGCAPPARPPAPPGATVDHVSTAFTVAPVAEAFDLDGDGVPDDAIDGLGPVLDPLVAERLATNVHVVIVQLADVDGWTRDAVELALFPAVDDDSDGSDNGSGDERFDATGFVDRDGLAFDRAPARLVAGAYDAFVATDTFQVGDFVFAVATGVHVRADASTDGETGVAGIGVTVDALGQALADEGFDPSLAALLGALADLDLDGDGVAETVSMAFRFEAVACALAPADTGA